MGRRNATVMNEADIVDDYAPRAKGRTGQARWSERSGKAGEERAPANPWVPPPGYTPARYVEPPKRTWPPMEAIYEERPPYCL